jgi:hypothetical protein
MILVRMVLYKYTNHYGVDILRNLEMKISPFNQLNDPFEITPFTRTLSEDEPRLHGRNRTRATARLHETLQLEIVAVIDSLNRLRESPDYELCQLSERKPGMLDELATERAKLLEKESAELEGQAIRLAEEIRELGGVESQIR